MNRFAAALAVTLALSAPALAQLPSMDPQQLEEMKKALAEAKKKQAARKALELQVPVQPVQTLTERLSSDGVEGEAEGGLVARSYTLTRSPDKKTGSFDTFSVTLLERPLPSPTSEDGNIVYLVMRKELSHLQGQKQTWKPLGGGKASIERWDYRVELDGRVTVVVKTTVTGTIVSPGVLSVDPADPASQKQESFAPNAKGNLERWNSMSKVFLMMGRTFEA